jgi:YggT family protein
MFMSPLQNALLFTVNSLFGLYISIVLFRFLLQLVRANFYNPIAQLVIKVTDPLLIPLRRFIPNIAGMDTAALLLAVLLQATKLTLTLLIKGFVVTSSFTSIFGLIIWSVGELTDLLLVIFLFSTFVQIISTWLQPDRYNPMLELLSQITEPLFTPARKLIPTVGVLDFSPMLVIFFIVLMRLLFADYIISIGKSII